MTIRGCEGLGISVGAPARQQDAGFVVPVAMWPRLTGGDRRASADATVFKYPR
jgi:hypothetical protein